MRGIALLVLLSGCQCSVGMKTTPARVEIGETPSVKATPSPAPLCVLPFLPARVPVVGIPDGIHEGSQIMVSKSDLAPLLRERDLHRDWMEAATKCLTK